MTMKLVKKNKEYSIFKRGDDRYAVKDANKKPVNGEEKVRILLAEGLIAVAEASPAVAAEADESASAEADDGVTDDGSPAAEEEGTEEQDEAV
ncbi:MAG: hypothetical protein AAGI88_10590 [Pseudomonadota bacterium]